MIHVSITTDDGQRIQVCHGSLFSAPSPRAWIRIETPAGVDSLGHTADRTPDLRALAHAILAAVGEPERKPITRKRAPRAATVRPPHASKPKRTPGSRDDR